MPAARPSQPAVANVVGALVAAGLRVAAVHVNPDGSFHVEVGEPSPSSKDEFARGRKVRKGDPLSWDDIEE